MTEVMAEDLERVFADKVKVEFIDTETVEIEAYPIVPHLLQRGYKFPFTLINGEPKFAGALMISEVKELVEEILEKEE